MGLGGYATLKLITSNGITTVTSGIMKTLQKKGLRQHICMNHIISQVDGMYDLEEEYKINSDKITLRAGTEAHEAPTEE